MKPRITAKFMLLAFAVLLTGPAGFAAPTVTLNSPTRQVFTPGQPLALAVTATGASSLTYQWTRNNLPINGAVNSTFHINQLTLRDAGAYTVHVTDNTGTTISAPMFVLVAPAATELRIWGATSLPAGSPPAAYNDLIAVAAQYAETFAVALRRGGSVTAWGTSSNVLPPPGSITDAVTLTTNMAVAAALKSGGQISSWRVEALYAGGYPLNLTDVVAISAGYSHTLALRSDGTVEKDSDSDSYLPPGLTGVIAIASFASHNLALKSDGTVVAWREFGGEGIWGETRVPRRLRNVTAIAAGQDHSLALKSDGTVEAWGSNVFGQVSVPAGLRNVVAIAAGAYHCLALKADGTVVAWGNNQNGQATVPADLTSVFAIHASPANSFALCDVTSEGPPAIAIQPADQTQFVGQPVSFMVNVVGAKPMTYQWQKNGQNIPGANAATYTIPSVSAGNLGAYSVVATNSAGSVTSSAAALLLNATPGDFNADGHPDVLWQNTATGQQRLWLMDGTTKSSEVSLGAMGINWQMAGSGDFNADGYNDIVWQNLATGERRVWLMDRTSFLSYADLGMVDPDWCIAAVADFNDDRHPDLLWQNLRTGECGIWLLEGVNLIGYSSLGIKGRQWSAAGAVDFDQDGWPDVAWQNTLTGACQVMRMVNTAETGAWRLGYVAPSWIMGAVADYNGDGSADILWQNTSTGEHGMWLLKGNRGFNSEIMGYAPLPSDSTDWVVGRIPRRPTPSDFNHDGKPDIVWENTVTGERKIWLMNGTAMDSEISLGVVGLDWEIATTGDMDNDGHCDLLWQNRSTGERGVWLMHDTNFAGYASLGTVDSAWQIVGTGDFAKVNLNSADNNTDILWQNTVTGERGIWLMSGTALSGYVSLGTYDVNYQVAGVGDFNRDDKPDIVWQNSASGVRELWLMHGVIFGSEISFGNVALSWQIAGVADYNLDGQLDILWQNTATGERGIWLLNDTALSGYISLGIQSTNWRIAN